MYFFALKKLKSNLIEKPFTERQALSYLIANVALYTLVIEILVTASSFSTTVTDIPPYGIWNFIDSTASIISVFVGIAWIYKCNKSDAGQYFLQRYLSIGWVTSLWFLIVMILVSLLTLAIADESNNNADPSLTVIYLALLIGYYWFFGKQIAEVAEKATYD
jgi:hypothetical protein